MDKITNPKIIHRVYFENYPPYRDPFLRYLETWKRELPDYEIKLWNASTFVFPENVDWINRALKAKSPVFLSEYIRWKVLQQYGGIYLDADCEVLNGDFLNRLIDDLYASDEYDAFLGVEEYNNGFPTAQTVAAKPNAELVQFMLDLYEGPLSSPLWHWREERSLIGPQLISLYFREKGVEENKGFFTHLKEPTISNRVKIYTQDYFSPKFTTTGTELNVSENTCVYHLFSNSNVAKVDPEREKHRRNPLLFKEYCQYLKTLSTNKKYKKDDGSWNYKELLLLAVQHPKVFAYKTKEYLLRKWKK